MFDEDVAIAPYEELVPEEVEDGSPPRGSRALSSMLISSSPTYC